MSRYSAPSAGQGFNRFRVWPGGADQFEHDKLGDNWDLADAIIGIPSVGNWPPSTGIDGGIYKEVKLLQLDRAAIGDFKFFFRPDAAIPIPTGWHVADGTVLAPSDHSFPGIATSVTLPNIINAMILGADPAKAVNAAAAAVGTNENSAAGAPGVGASGGENSHILTIPQMPTHDHGGVTGDLGFDNQRVTAGFAVPVLLGSVLNNEQGAHHHTIAAQGGGLAHENRPRWVGLIPLIKVKFVTSLT